MSVGSHFSRLTNHACRVWLMSALMAICVLFVGVFSSTTQAKTATAMVAESAVASASAEATASSVQGTDAETDELIVLDRVLKQNGQDIPVLGGVANTATAGAFDDDDEKTKAATAVVDDKTPASNAAEKASDDLYLNEPVVDEARILLASDKAALEQKLRGWHHQGLAQAAIVIVPTTGFEPIFDYGMKIVDRWKLGNNKNDNGLLILVAVNDRKMHIFTGYGVEGVIPDVMAKRIIRDDITPYFKKRQYANGLMSGLNAIEKRLTTDPAILAQADENRKLNKNQQGDTGGLNLGLLIFAVIFGSILTAIFGRFFGSVLTAGGFTTLSLMTGATLGVSLFGAFFVFVLTLIGFFNLFAGGGSGRGGHIGGGGFGGGLGGGGGFGGGGFGGGGGGFGGGGAGGSW